MSTNLTPPQLAPAFRQPGVDNSVGRINPIARALNINTTPASNNPASYQRLSLPPTAQQPTPGLNTAGRPNYVIGSGAGGKIGKKIYGDIAGFSRGIQQFLPSILNTLYRAQIEQAPALTENQLRMLQHYGPQFTRQEADLSRLARESEARTDIDLLNQYGPSQIAARLNLARQADPEFFNLREGIGRRGSELLEGQDPNSLTEAEIANVERTSNRNNINSGTAFSGSPTSTVKSALMYDDRLQQKRSNLNNTLGNLGSVLPGTRSGIFNESSTQQAQGQFGRNLGQSNFQSSTQGAQGSAGSLASNLLGQGSSLAGGVRNYDLGIRGLPSDFERIAGALPDY